MNERRLLTLRGAAVAGSELPYAVLEGARPGPRLCLLAGVHGCEYAPIAAVQRIVATLDTAALAGTVTAVPVVNLEAFRTRTPFVSPADGKNLNRCFPGDPDGSYSEALAHNVFTELIAGSDALVDLHAGDMVEALCPFALYDESPVAARAGAMARAFGLPYVVCSERAGTRIGGTTSAAAADAGIPAITPEVGGRGLLEEPAVAAHVGGVLNVLRLLGMLEGESDPPPADQRLVRRFLWLRSRAAGWWEPALEAGDEVPTGGLLGTVRDLFGSPLEEIRAPEDGVLLFVTSSPAVAADGLLLGLGAGVEPSTG